MPEPNIGHQVTMTGPNSRYVENEHNYGTSTQHALRLWVLSSTKENVKRALPENLVGLLPEHCYHDTDCKAWKPFGDTQENIGELVEAFKHKVSAISVETRFLGDDPYPSSSTDITETQSRIDKLLLVIDPLALFGNHETAMVRFDNTKIGTCLVLACRTLPDDLFRYICGKLQATFSTLYMCFVDPNEVSLHFLFPISTKDLFMRLLMNLDIERLKVATTIQGRNQPKDNYLRNTKFGF